MFVEFATAELCAIKKIVKQKKYICIMECSHLAD